MKRYSQGGYKGFSVQLGLPYIELFYGRNVGGPNRSYFLYETGPTRWRENWRHIRGFSVKLFGHYLTFCAWRQKGVYVEQKPLTWGDNLIDWSSL